MPPSFGHHFQGILLRIPSLVPCAVTPTGLSPSAAQLSSCFGFPREGLERVLQHHIPSDFRHRIRFALCRFHSPLLPASRLLSLPPGTKMFPFPGFPLAAASDGGLLRQEVPFGNPRFNGCMHLAWAFRRLPRPSSALEPSHPPGGLA
jgi:hypothetical protein